MVGVCVCVPVLEVGQGWPGCSPRSQARGAPRALGAKGPPDLRRGGSVCLHLGSLSLLTTSPLTHCWGRVGVRESPRSSSGEGAPTVGGVGGRD